MIKSTIEIGLAHAAIMGFTLTRRYFGETDEDVLAEIDNVTSKCCKYYVEELLPNLAKGTRFEFKHNMLWNTLKFKKSFDDILNRLRTKYYIDDIFPNLEIVIRTIFSSDFTSYC